MFIGRKAELKFLNDKYKEDHGLSDIASGEAESS